MKKKIEKPKKRIGEIEKKAKKKGIEKSMAEHEKKNLALGKKTTEKAIEKKAKIKKVEVGKKKIKKEEIKRVKIPEELKKLQWQIKDKKKIKFRGRFGKRGVRRIKNKKWQKWRYPRGRDIRFRKEDGRIPKSGYRTNKEIRFRHPSGFMEKIVWNKRGLERIDRNKFAVRLASSVGKRKRIEIEEMANKLGIKLLN